MLTREFSRTLPGHALALEGLLKVTLANVLRLSHTSRSLRRRLPRRGIVCS